jgi:hypothetical protein
MKVSGSSKTLVPIYQTTSQETLILILTAERNLKLDIISNFKYVLI